MPVFTSSTATLVGGCVALLDDAHARGRRLPSTAPARRARSRSGRRMRADSTVAASPLATRAGRRARRASRPQQRRVAGQHDDGGGVVEVVVGERRQPDDHGVAGAALGRCSTKVTLAEPAPAPAPSWSPARRRGRPRRPCARRRGRPAAWMHVHHHRPAADQVQRLGPVGAHPRALAGGQDDRRDRHARVSIAAGRVDGRSPAPGEQLGGEGSNPYSRNQNPLSCLLDDPRRVMSALWGRPLARRFGERTSRSGSVSNPWVR